MKEIKAIVRLYRLDAVLDALHSHAELPGVTVSLVRGFGRTVGRSARAAQAPIQYGTVEMAKVECVVNDDQVDVVVDIIRAAACTHSAGDGKIVICDVSEVVKIKTGDRLQQIE
jgi:nitrogen regulatory protein PII